MTRPCYFTVDEDIPELELCAGDSVRFTAGTPPQITVVRYLNPAQLPALRRATQDGRLARLPEAEPEPVAPRLSLVR